ncbi:MAG: two-component system, OmpR family, manganese sensing sensor histidine kinase [Phormidesmis priestleyi Ana]|uniref:histidine kinase n=1 Tax=Phormidesmis priestleyi Ana TaxID=1666911 RepID=A0A0P8DB02_9CYAN|nr:MAG: two-component system, OmpR family, manganese sensing sensor histidine kinase [Phormidesmis priestleyi Ana]
MFQTTRRRLALWYTTVTAVLLLLFASGVYTYVRSTLVERVDDTLNHVIEIVQRQLVIQPSPTNGLRIFTASGTPETSLKVNIEDSFRNSEAASEDDHIDLEWFSPEGNLLWTTFAKPHHIGLHVNPNGETVTPPDGIVLRQITRRVQSGNQLLGYIRVSHPWFEVSKPSRQLIIDLALGIGFMLTAVASIGWFLSGLAMQPVAASYQQLKQFTADASHELRNPIAVIQTNVQVALADPDEQFQRSQLEVIERLTRRLGRLVDDLLFLARQESGLVPIRRDRTNLTTLLKNIIEEQQAVAQDKSLTLSAQIPNTDLCVQGDHDQLIRLFTNLIANAIQYTSTGEISITCEASASQITTSIQDTGIGIPAHDLTRIFDRFYRVDPARSRSAGGSGLGLAIAKIITDNHQGQLTLTSNLGKGTCATVILPAKSSAKSPAKSQAKETPQKETPDHNSAAKALPVNNKL